MDPISRFVLALSAKARAKRAATFRNLFTIDRNTKILDLGSEDGSTIYGVLGSIDFSPENVFIADIDEKKINAGAERYGFSTAVLEEDKPLPFPDKYFDIVFCSSVIEHVTVPKEKQWTYVDGAEFSRDSRIRQSAFAKEIIRVGKQYFVQTPSRTFPIESHTWLPFVGYLPRRYLLKVLKISNRYWVKAAYPDFNLLGKQEMRELFPDAAIMEEVKLGFTKSIMAVKADSQPI